MLKRTAPAVSFTASHRALMMRTNKPLLGHDMSSTERYKTAWDEIPLTTIGWSRTEMYTFYWRCMYDLGLRDVMRLTKTRHMLLYVMLGLTCVTFYRVLYPNFIYFPIYQTFPEHYKKEGAMEHAKAQGIEVYCADGKFLKPYFHMSPPMLTMTTEDL